MLRAWNEYWWRSGLRRWFRSQRFYRAIGTRRGRRLGQRRISALHRTADLRMLASGLLGVLGAFLVLELALRVIPLPSRLATHLFGCYESQFASARITFHSPELQMALHKPGFESRCAWGHTRWTHRTDAWGQRNPEAWDTAEVAVIGDSIVYGHGVEEEQTTTHFLRQRLATRVVNLGLTGASLPQYLALLRNFALPLKPRIVFVVLFGGNDVVESLAYRSSDALMRFISSSGAPEARIVPRSTLLAADVSAPLLDRAMKEALSLRTIRYLVRGGPPSQPWHWEDDHALPAPNSTPESPLTESERRSGDYLRAVLRLMQSSANEADAHLVIVYMPSVWLPVRQDRVLYVLTREATTALDLPLMDATPVVYGNGRRLRGVQLPYDGHLTEEGHRRLADQLATFLEHRHFIDGRVREARPR